jgi:predicted DNA-binding transcriptional regulator AlpA
MQQQYLSVKSVSNSYDIAVSTVWLRLNQGKIPKPLKLHNSSTRWKLDDLLAHEAKELEAAK